MTVINDILDFSKIESGKFSLEIIDFDLVSVVEGQCELLAGKIKEKGLSLVTYVDPSINRLLLGDPGRIAQVLLNLLGNATKFTASGSISMRVEPIHSNDSSVKVLFSVKDSGIGLSPDSVERLFKPFSQADGSTARKYGGTGLGLSICKQLVEMMGGQIGVDSEEGQGANFWFTVEFEFSSKSSLTGRMNESPLNLKVLVVDDDPVASEVLSRYMQNWGSEAEIASTPAVALQMLHEGVIQGKKFDLAILDKRMPEIDGFVLAETILNDPLLIGIKLILTTAYDRLNQKDEAIKSGFSTYLLKPVKQSDLFDRIRSLFIPEVTSEQIIEKAVPLAAPSQPYQGKRILVAEDNTVNQLLTTTQLKHLGYYSQAVGNGLEAVDAYSRGKFDLILMDCQMPDMDGFQATQAIRDIEKKSGHHIIIIALTANAMAEDKKRCLDAGMDGYISKPVKKETLAKILDEFFRANLKVA